MNFFSCVEHFMGSSQKERRKSADIWLKIIRMLTLLSWVFFTLSLILSFYAAPEKSYGVLRYHNISIRQFWLTPLTGYLYILLWLSAFLSYSSIFFNKFRGRRKSDSPLYNQLLLFLISTAWVVYIVTKLS